MCGDEVNPDFMNDAQPHQVRLKYELTARLDGLAAERRTMPRVAGLRIDALGAANSPKSNRQITEGTRRQVREGMTSENRPA